MSAFTHPKDIFPRRELNTAAKITLFSDIRKFGKQNLLFYAKIAPIRRIGQIGRIGKLEDGQWVGLTPACLCRSDAPRCSSRSDCQVKAILHPKGKRGRRWATGRGAMNND